MRHVLITVGVLLLVSTQQALAQTRAGETASSEQPVSRESTALEPGTRIRILLLSLNPTPIEGRIVALGPDTLRIIATGFRQRNVAVPIDSLSTLEVSHKSKTWIIPGAVAGFALGYAAAYLISDNSETDCWLLKNLRCESATKEGNGYLFAYLGALVGAGVGWTLSPDRWEEIPLKNVHVSWTPGGRARLSVSLAVP